MTYTQRKAVKILDHAIEHLGPTTACGLLILPGGHMSFLPADNSPKQAARTIMAKAMCEVVKSR